MLRNTDPFKKTVVFTVPAAAISSIRSAVSDMVSKLKRK